MSPNPTVRDYQHALARHVSDYQRAVARLEDAVARQEQEIAAQDEKVATARRSVDGAVASMAGVLGPELTANVLGVDVKDVRRLMKTRLGESGLR